MNIKELNNVLSDIDSSHRHINHGGCACMAVMIADQMEAAGINYRIVVPWNGDIDETRELIPEELRGLKENWYGYYYQFHHVWVEAEIDGQLYAIDSEGAKPVPTHENMWGITCKGRFLLEEMRSMANQETWNSAFPRDQLPSMAKMVEQGFKRVI